MYSTTMLRPNEQGNVLFLILIAVALFAVLSYAVTSSTNVGSSDISKDKARANASQIIQYGSSIRNTISRLKISNGCTDTNLDFYNELYKNIAGAYLTYINSSTPADGNCKVFSSSGGNLNPIIPLPEALDFVTPLPTTSARQGHGAFRVGQIPNIGTDGIAGTASANDLLLIVLILNKPTCMAINEILNVSNRGSDAPAEILPTMGFYTNGSYAASGIFTSAEFVGHPAFCFKRSDQGTYIFVQTLIER